MLKSLVFLMGMVPGSRHMFEKRQLMIHLRFILKKMHALLGMEIMCLFLKEGKSCKFSQMEKFVEETQLL